MFDVWLLKFSLLSRVTPRRITSGTGFLRILSISTEKLSGMVFSPRIMTWHFSGFIFVKLSLNQSIIREHCDSIRNFGSFRDLKHVYNVLSSAKLQRFPSPISSNKSFIKMLNNSGPKTDPWGIPIKISTHSLKQLFILVLCFLFVTVQQLNGFSP